MNQIFLLMIMSWTSLLLYLCLAVVECFGVDAALVTGNTTQSPSFAPSMSFTPSFSFNPSMSLNPSASPRANPTQEPTERPTRNNSSACQGAISQDELTALKTLYNSTNGTRWLWRPVIQGAKWTFPALTSDPCGSSTTSAWQGITCNHTDTIGICQIEALKLSGYNLDGSLPSEIGLLSGLVVLDFFFNRLVNTIPVTISLLIKLSELDISTNSIVGRIPSQLSTLTRLTYLNLDFNSLTNSIPSELSTLANLNSLDLCTNSITGSISSHFSAWTRLSYVGLNTNLLSSSIPSELSAWTGLFIMLLHENRLTSTLPRELSTWTGLENLNLNNNFLFGEIPTFIGNFHNLTELCLGSNSFTSSLSPDIFSGLQNLRVLQLDSNNFEGKLPSIDIMNQTLEYLDVSANNFNGDPFSFIGFSNIQLVNISSNRFQNSSSLRLSFSAASSEEEYATPSLLYLDISDNYLTGSLPDSIGGLFPNLNLLSASNNCFKAHIPETLCNINNITNILMNKLGSQCAATDVLSNEFFQHFINSKYTIPPCLLAMPSLQTLHLISNSLFGTIGDVNTSLVSLSLVGNLLVGTISKSIQQSYSLTDLQLSLNRFSGTLSSDAFQNLPRNSVIQLFRNRISGNIPPSLSSFESGNVDILNGNLFNCAIEAPKNLKNYDTYRCGTTTIDFYQNVYIIVGFVIATGLVGYYFIWKKSVANNTPLLFVTYLETAPPFPSPLFSVISNSTFLLTSLLVALFMTLFNLFMKMADGSATVKGTSNSDLAFDTSFSTHELVYGWRTAFMYVHGIWPFAMILIGLFITLFAYLRYMKVGDENSKDRISISVPPSIYHAIRKFLTRSTRLLSNSYYRRFLLLQLFNVSIIGGVNIVYIFIENATILNLHGDILRGAPAVALSVFKICWSNTFLVYMIKYGVMSKLPEQVVFGNYVFALLFIYVLAPIITVYFTSPDCFFYRLAPLPSIDEIYEGIRPENICSYFTCKNHYFRFPITQSITPTWIYSYQCGFSILKEYIPAVLSTYTISGILLPVLQLFILYFPPSSRIRNSNLSKMLLEYTLNAMSGDDILVSLGKSDRRHFRTYRYLSNVLIDIVMLFTFGIFCPYLSFIIVTSIVVNEVIKTVQIGSYLQDKLQYINSPGGSNSIRMTSINSEQRRSYLEQSSILSDLEKNTYQMRVIISAVHSQVVDVDGKVEKSQIQDVDVDVDKGFEEKNKLKEAKEDSSVIRDSRLQATDEAFLDDSAKRMADDRAIKSKLVSFIYLDNAQGLFLSMWTPMLLTILIFSTFTMFDMIADVYMNVPGLIATITFWIMMLLCFYSRDRFVKIVAFLTPRCYSCNCCVHTGSSINTFIGSGTGTSNSDSVKSDIEPTRTDDIK